MPRTIERNGSNLEVALVPEERLRSNTEIMCAIASSAARRIRLERGQRRGVFVLQASCAAPCRAEQTPVQSVEVIGLRASAGKAGELKRDRGEAGDSIVAVARGRRVRFGASRSITRPNFDHLSPSLTLIPDSVNASLNQGSAGNPALRPIRPSGLDLAFEACGEVNASVAFFYRHVDGFVTNMSAPQTYDGVTYQVSRPHDSLPAEFRGVELAYQPFCTGLPGVLGGLGRRVNGTRVSSQTPNAAVGGNLPLANLSRLSANVIGLYDRGPLSLRVAWNWRDRYLSGVTQVVGVGALPNYVQGDGWLDASIAWRINAQMTVRAEGGNLLDPVRHSAWGGPTCPQDTWQNGRQVSIALAWRL